MNKNKGVGNAFIWKGQEKEKYLLNRIMEKNKLNMIIIELMVSNFFRILLISYFIPSASSVGF